MYQLSNKCKSVKRCQMSKVQLKLLCLALACQSKRCIVWRQAEGGTEIIWTTALRNTCRTRRRWMWRLRADKAGTLRVIEALRLGNGHDDHQMIFAMKAGVSSFSLSWLPRLWLWEKKPRMMKSTVTRWALAQWESPTWWAGKYLHGLKQNFSSLGGTLYCPLVGQEGRQEIKQHCNMWFTFPPHCAASGCFWALLKCWVLCTCAVWIANISSALGNVH